MSKQRYIQDSFWTDPYIEKLNIEEKLVFLYYLTNPLCNIAGIYEIRDSRVSYELNIPVERIEIIKNKFVKDKKILIFKDWICLFNFAKHQSPNPNVLIGMQRIIDGLPSELKALKGFERLSHFTLLNLTINSTFSNEKDAKNKNMKNTWKYNEKNSSDTFEDSIDLETGEYSKPKESKRQKAINYIKEYFSAKCLKELKLKPVLTYKQNILIANLFNKNKMKPSEITAIIDWWFDTEQDKTKLIQISNCLSSWNINKYNISKNL